MDFQQAKRAAEQARERSRELGLTLRSFPRSAMGLVPDHIKFSEPYQTAKRAFDQAFIRERQANEYLVKNFKKELASERRQLREVVYRPEKNETMALPKRKVSPKG